ncbi:protein of unknown function [Ruminococcaceae bacterium BL-6]|nr:protein of unknown function [Ruminococcaceae bacterium BL-6]
MPCRESGEKMLSIRSMGRIEGGMRKKGEFYRLKRKIRGWNAAFLPDFIRK